MPAAVGGGFCRRADRSPQPRESPKPQRSQKRPMAYPRALPAPAAAAPVVYSGPMARTAEPVPAVRPSHVIDIDADDYPSGTDRVRWARRGGGEDRNRAIDAFCVHFRRRDEPAALRAAEAAISAGASVSDLAWEICRLEATVGRWLSQHRRRPGQNGQTGRREDRPPR